MDNNKLAIDLFNKNAQLYHDKFMNVDGFAEPLNIFCDNLTKVNAHVLELACGPGNITKYLLNKQPDLNILATDLAPQMLRLAEANNPKAEIKALDCREIKSLNQQFDAIICGFALPYLSKEEALLLIKDSVSALYPGGLLYISTMEDDYNKSGWQTASTGERVYMYYHQADYLVKAMENNGLTLLYQTTQPAANGDTDLILISKSRLP